MVGQDSCKDLTSEERENLAMNQLAGLRNGGMLIVRIPGYNVQISELQRLLSNPDLRPESRVKLERKLNGYINERDDWRRLVMTAFREMYEFSDVAFYFDHDHELIDQQQAQVWLNEDGEMIAHPGIWEKRAMQLEQGVTPTRQLPAFILTTGEGEEVCAPLASYFMIHKLSDILFIGSRARQKKMNKLVRTIQDHFASLM